MEHLKGFIDARRKKLRTWYLYSDKEILEAEKRLGVIFPKELKMALKELGFGHYTKVEGLWEPGGIVEWTERYRNEFNLPSDYVVVTEMGDEGMILINMLTGITYWIGMYDYNALINGAELRRPLIFSNYGELVIQTITDLEREGKEY